MGLLSKGTPLKWEASKKYHQTVKDHGVKQFIKLYEHYKGRVADAFLWGDEVETILLVLDKATKSVKLSLRGAEVIKKLQELGDHIEKQTNTTFHARFLPEYGCFMVEATPGKPYGNTTADVRMVEPNMRLRRRMIEKMLKDNEVIVSMGNYPLMGVGQFTHPPHPPKGPVALSLFVPDAVISPHPRFATLTENIRTRRGSKVNIRIPRFKDTPHVHAHSPKDVASPVSFDELPDASSTTPAVPTASSSAPPTSSSTLDDDDDDQKGSDDEIYMDCMAFGMGCACLQVTFQSRSLREARHLYDNLAVLSPVMLALTAATPFYHGQISDIDVRWTVISQAVDDRTPAERGLADLGPNEQRIHKSRYDSIDCYLSQEAGFKEKYNDIDLVVNQKVVDELKEHGIDERLARHVGHLYIRDPLVIYEEKISLDDNTSSDHFENIQSTNWQNVRFKPPPPNVSTGWRVEFRTMEVQITDFENAAYTVFVALMSRAILLFNLNFYIPISKVDENMKRAHVRDAARKGKFFWRKNMEMYKSDDEPTGCDEYAEFTMKQLFCGCEDAKFPGLVPIVRAYLDAIDCDERTREVVDEYLDLILARARGDLLTLAQFFRRFVCNHPDYKHDSKLNERIVYDLVQTVRGIEQGSIVAPQLYGSIDLSARAEREKQRESGVPVEKSKPSAKDNCWPSPDSNTSWLSRVKPEPAPSNVDSKDNTGSAASATGNSKGTNDVNDDDVDEEVVIPSSGLSSSGVLLRGASLRLIVPDELDHKDSTKTKAFLKALQTY